MSADLLEGLRSASSSEEQAWFITRELLESLPIDVKSTAWVAALPHWFHADILAALLERPLVDCATLYADLQRLPFVDRFEARQGHNIHPVIRAAMGDQFWRERPEEYVRLSTRAADYFSRSSERDWQREYIYHLLIAAPDKGADLLRDLYTEWMKSLNSWDLANPLAQTITEQVEAERLQGRARGWAYYVKGDIDRRNDRGREAKKALQLGLISAGDDKLLKANCTYSLGRVHGMDGEYTEARTRYEEARPIYSAIGDRLGEANCMYFTGEDFYRLHDYSQAVAIYREARMLYAAIGDKWGEAHCVLALGRVNHALDEFSEARTCFEQARSLYSASDDRRSQADCIISLGQVYFDFGEHTRARTAYEEARIIYTAVGDRLGEAACDYGLGEVAMGERDWSHAKQLLQAALAVYRQMDKGFDTGHALWKLGMVSEHTNHLAGAVILYGDAMRAFESIGAKESEYVREDLQRLKGTTAD